MNKELPKRKHTRLKDFNYDKDGAYFVTICVHHRKPILSRVGRGLAPAEETKPELILYGKIVEEELLSLNKSFPCISIDCYVIMPNHLHAILIYDEEAAGASPRPTVMDAICIFKSVATKRCKEVQPIKKIFQTSFYDRVIRNREEYTKIQKYIYENPLKWEEDELYAE